MVTNFRRDMLVRTLKMLDLAVLCTAFVVALDVASGSFTWASFSEILFIRVAVANMLTFAAYLTLCSVVFSACGLYASHRLSRWDRRLQEILLAASVIVGVLLGMSWPFRLAFATNRFLLLFWSLIICGLFAIRETIHLILRFVRLRGRNLRNVVVIGEEPHATALAQHIRHDVGLGLPGTPNNRCKEHEMVKSDVISELETLIDQEPVDEVFVALPRARYESLIQTIVASCEEQGIIVRIQTAIFDLKLARWESDELDGKPLVTIQSGPSDALHLAAKRLMDILGSAVLLFFTAPLLAIVALLIKPESPGPVFFTQDLAGLNRRRFKLFKFRTMSDRAEQLQRDLEHLNEADGPVFKIRNDPRITRLGKFLRRFSIDELPQLLNVLKGDMSLVGPRPSPVRDVKRINTQWHKRRFSVKPGLTCLGR